MSNLSNIFTIFFITQQITIHLSTVGILPRKRKLSNLRKTASECIHMYCTLNQNDPLRYCYENNRDYYENHEWKKYGWILIHGHLLKPDRLESTTSSKELESRLRCVPCQGVMRGQPCKLIYYYNIILYMCISVRFPWTIAPGIQVTDKSCLLSTAMSLSFYRQLLCLLCIVFFTVLSNILSKSIEILI